MKNLGIKMKYQKKYGGKNKKGTYWYLYEIGLCPVCFREYITKTRQYTKKPKDYTKRHIEYTRYDYCDM